MARGKIIDIEQTVQKRLPQALVPVEEQPYPVPENWCWVNLENVSLIIMGQSPSGSDTTSDSSYTPLIGGAADMGVLYPTPTRYTKAPTKLSTDKDIILCIRATLGQPIFSDGEYCLGRGVAGIRPYVGSREFFRYFFLYFNQYLYDKATGTTFAQVNSQVLQKMPFPLPPLAEQQRIVDRIESLFAKLDEAKEKAQSVVDGFETQKVAILHKAFSGELTAKWRKHHNASLSQWAKRSLGKCGTWCGGGTPSMANPEYWDNGDLLWITSKDMKSDQIEDTILHTNMTGVMNSAANYIETPSVLFVMRSGILRHTLPIAMVKKPFTVNQDLKVLSPAGIDLDYLFWVCKGFEKDILSTCMKSGTTVESIDSKKLMAYEIPIPPASEQVEIVNTIKPILDREQQAKEAAEAVLDRIETMKKSTLARAFRGQLGTNDPAEESAIELLKQVLRQTPTRS